MQNSTKHESSPKVLITGDLGFVGTETKKLFDERGIKYVGYDLMDGYDILDLNQLSEAVNQCDVVLHLAAVARFSDADENPKRAFEINVDGTRSVVEACKINHKPLVFASTGSVYMPIHKDPPITEDFPAVGNSVYGCTKALGEKYVEQHNPHIILRYAHLYGKEKRHHGLIGGFMNRIKRGLEPTLYGGKQSNDFTYITDVAEANYLACVAPWDKWNQAYNVGTGEELSALEAGKLICENAGWDVDNINVKEQRTVDPQRFVYDMTKAEVMLGFKAKYNFKKGLNEMFKDE